MATVKKQDLDQELAYQKEQAKAYDVSRTPDSVIERYKICANATIHPKEKMFELVHKNDPRTICDFGCGGGQSSTELARLGYRVIGVDISPEMIDIANTRAQADDVAEKCEFIVGSTPDLKWMKEQVDLIFIECVLHHIVDIPAGLDCLDRILKAGGLLVIQEPIAFSPSLRFLRKFVPVKTDLSANEQQLLLEDIKLIDSRFKIEKHLYYTLFSRLDRLFGHRIWFAKVDRMISNALPFLNRYFGTLIIQARKPKD